MNNITHAFSGGREEGLDIDVVGRCLAHKQRVLYELRVKGCGRGRGLVGQLTQQSFVGHPVSVHCGNRSLRIC